MRAGTRNRTGGTAQQTTSTGAPVAGRLRQHSTPSPRLSPLTALTQRSEGGTPLQSSTTDVPDVSWSRPAIPELMSLRDEFVRDVEMVADVYRARFDVSYGLVSVIDTEQLHIPQHVGVIWLSVGD